MRVLVAAVVVASAPWSSCGNKDIEWEQVNGDDAVDVSLRPSDADDPCSDPGDPVSVELTSSSGAFTVGEATVLPGASAAGCDHDVFVDISHQPFEECVGRVAVQVEFPDKESCNENRPKTCMAEFELEQDSADHGFWWTSLRSVGEAGETRTDTFSFFLYVDSEITCGEGSDTGSR